MPVREGAFRCPNDRKVFRERLTLRQADQAREDFAAILDELDFLKIQVSWLPARAWLSRMAWIGFDSV